MEYKKHKERRLRHWISFPFIWMMIIPIAILDLFLEIYHHICFPLYGIKIVKRSEYIMIDRQKLKYLRWYDKIQCAYCGYANGIMAYGTRIAGDTEKYWCAIKHSPKKGFNEPAHHKEFLKYNDEKSFRRKYGK
ncbi:MAG: hypothetical protein ACP5NV_05700 [Candidatus Woesearchaeota archaeon]